MKGLLTIYLSLSFKDEYPKISLLILSVHFAGDLSAESLP